MSYWNHSHISRGWPGQTHIEDACPCPQEPCGMVAYSRISPECDQHPPSRSKTIRDSHPAAICPALMKPGLAADVENTKEGITDV